MKATATVKCIKCGKEMAIEQAEIRTERQHAPEVTREEKTRTMTTITNRATELAEAIRTADTWDMDMLAELCELAGMRDEWDAADGETFEAVAYAAADKLGVEII